MPQYQFFLIVPTTSLTDDQILDATDALGDAECNDASVRGHTEGMELLFDRSAESLQHAISSAVAAIERAGYKVSRIEMEREAIHG